MIGIGSATPGTWVTTTDGQVGVIVIPATAAGATVATPTRTQQVPLDQLAARPAPTSGYIETYLGFADAFADIEYAEAFRRIGLGPGEAAGWANRGFGPGGAARWSALGFTAHEATAYADRYLSPQHARLLVTVPAPGCPQAAA
jgi:hypothetical protein